MPWTTQRRGLLEKAKPTPRRRRSAARAFSLPPERCGTLRARGHVLCFGCDSSRRARASRRRDRDRGRRAPCRIRVCSRRLGEAAHLLPPVRVEAGIYDSSKPLGSGKPLAGVTITAMVGGKPTIVSSPGVAFCDELIHGFVGGTVIAAAITNASGSCRSARRGARTISARLTGPQLTALPS